MISARLRYAALGLAAITLGALALMYAIAGGWAPAAVCLLLTAACAEACSWVRLAAEQLQALHHQARLQARADRRSGIEPWASWCCERGWLTHGDLHNPTTCTRETS
ncbi:hypothetical protein PV356_35245 [Streptomyces sp. WI03-5b]|uniref:hypothetical protein n=1 Tax=Streptomyces sp. WI03-5b TaxID=462946 RepID=UPI0029AE1BF9|nr:hypothetical protein [Streptomyces sp. WI03-5b]MDX2624677.1 hypothetical protein [Streptomyces sp. WI03-5b]